MSPARGPPALATDESDQQHHADPGERHREAIRELAVIGRPRDRSERDRGQRWVQRVGRAPFPEEARIREPSTVGEFLRLRRVVRAVIEAVLVTGHRQDVHGATCERRGRDNREDYHEAPAAHRLRSVPNRGFSGICTRFENLRDQRLIARAAFGVHIR
jgi:hypothetical protein